MSNNDLIQQAIAAARAGRKSTARELFLQVVQAEPRNELAWLWLVGLLENVNERINACQQVLVINPGHAAARAHLDRLLGEQQAALQAGKLRAKTQFRSIQELAQAGQSAEALQGLRGLAQEGFLSAQSLRLMANLSPEMDEKIDALQKLVQLAPDDSLAQQELERLRHFQNNPLDLAALYEEQGDLPRAIEAYNQATARPELSDQWDRIYWKVKRLENLRIENLAYVSPLIHISRLTAGPLLLYLFLMFIQMGFNPLAYFAPHLWLGFVVVLLGAVMTALASVRSRHRIWTLLFKDAGAGGTPVARLVMSAVGWVLVGLPYLVMIFDSFFRLMNYLDTATLR
jgi:tetratricopeptide (TPR) repeat protein